MSDDASLQATGKRKERNQKTSRKKQRHIAKKGR
jgi:hypothetical protein